ncbi:MAG: lytic transglycosylase domain-containing protein [Gammaproteobacteria bacterium]
MLVQHDNANTQNTNRHLKPICGYRLNKRVGHLFSRQSLIISVFYAFFTLFSHSAQAAEIYIYENQYGEKLFADRPLHKTGYRLVRRQGSNDASTQPTAHSYHLDPALIKAVIHAESAFDPNATSRVGAQGLMQLMPATARSHGVTNSYNPEQNIMGGSKYLRYLMDKYDGNLSMVLAAYNAGEGRVRQYNGIPPFKETQNYVKKVIRLHQKYTEAHDA